MSSQVRGTIDDGWEPVREVFEAAFADGLESGAAVVVYRDGQPVVDLWGGVADARDGTPWVADTVVPVFSTTKGVTAICAHMLIERGLLDLDAPVARYWPEFASAGKQDITVRWLLSHQAGLSVLDTDLTFDDLRAVEPVLRAIEQQAPKWEPGTQVAYHAITMGHLVGELVHRITGRTLGRFIADEMVGPLHLRAWLGLPEDEPVTPARLEGAPKLPDDDGPLAEAMRELLANARRSGTLGSALPDGFVDGQRHDMNDRETLAIELGAVNMVADARSLARIYAATVSEVDGVRLLSDAAAASAAVLEVTAGRYWGLPDELGAALLAQSPVGLGFILTARLGPSSFGHHGAGGSLAFGDLDHRIGFAYVMNRMGLEGDQRAHRLVDAVRSCL